MSSPSFPLVSQRLELFLLRGSLGPEVGRTDMFWRWAPDLTVSYGVSAAWIIDPEVEDRDVEMAQAVDRANGKIGAGVEHVVWEAIGRGVPDLLFWDWDYAALAGA